MSERHAPYYVRWVPQVYAIAQRPLGETLPLEAEQHGLVQLQRQCQDWQIKQARQALRLYRYFLGSQQDKSQPLPGEPTRMAWRELSEKVQRVMRLQHKSLQTEKTYLMWRRRFEGFRRNQPQRRKDAENGSGTDLTAPSQNCVHIEQQVTAAPEPLAHQSWSSFASLRLCGWFWHDPRSGMGLVLGLPFRTALRGSEEPRRPPTPRAA